MTSQFYVQGTSNGNPLDTFRLELGRKDPDGDLLSGLKATEYEVGDVSSPILNMVTSNSLGRGLYVTNRSLNTSDNFDVHSFTGDAIPGYQVELYRNDELVAFQTVDSTGRYNFVDIPVLFGDNVFRIVLYGPEGQREERVENISTSSASLKENQFEYTFGIDQRGMSFIPIAPTSSNPLDPSGTQAVASMRYGITSNFMAGVSAAETKLTDGEHRYVGATAGTSFGGLLTETDYVKDMTNNGWAAGATALTGFEDISLRARYRKYNNFVSESVNNDGTPLSSEAEIDANTQFYIPILGQFSYGLAALRQTYVNPNEATTDTYSIRSSKTFWGISFTDTSQYIINTTKQLQDTFGLETRVADVDLRMNGIYEFNPTQGLQSVDATANYNIADKLSAQSEVTKSLTSGGTTAYTQTLYWDFDAFRLGLNGQMNNQGAYSVGFNVSFSAAHNPVTDSWITQPKPFAQEGGVAGQVYVNQHPDIPNNNDAQDPANIVADAKIRVNHGEIPVGTDGQFFVAPVDPYKPIKVAIEPESIKDPLLTPDHKSYEIITRPGDIVAADFPMVVTTTIEGNVFIQDNKGQKNPTKDIVVQLEDAYGKILRRVVTEFDGYFSFDLIRAGEYWLTVPEEALKVYNAEIADAPHILIKEVSEFITDKNIILRPKQNHNPLEWTTLLKLLDAYSTRQTSIPDLPEQSLVNPFTPPPTRHAVENTTPNPNILTYTPIPNEQTFVTPPQSAPVTAPIPAVPAEAPASIVLPGPAPEDMEAAPQKNHAQPTSVPAPNPPPVATPSPLPDVPVLTTPPTAPQPDATPQPEAATIAPPTRDNDTKTNNPPEPDATDAPVQIVP